MAEIVMRLKIARPKLRRSCQRGDRLIEFPHRVKQRAEIQVGAGVVRAKHNGFLEGFQSGFEHPLPLEGQAQIVVRLGTLWPMLKLSAKGVGRLGIAPKRQQRVAVMEINVGTVRRELDRAAEGNCGAGGVTASRQRDPKS